MSRKIKKNIQKRLFFKYKYNQCYIVINVAVQCSYFLLFASVLGGEQTMGAVAGYKHWGPDKIVQPQEKNNHHGLAGLQAARSKHQAAER